MGDLNKPCTALAAFLCLAFLFSPSDLHAHQPRMIDGSEIKVTDPEISKAYYATLSGRPHTYSFKSTRDFDLYVNLLVPDILHASRDFSAAIFKDGSQILELKGLGAEWKPFYEPYGADSYWVGPEYRARSGPGNYEIRVQSPSNQGKYVLAIGERENFNFQEIRNLFDIVPRLKNDFFEESPLTFILSPFGAGLIVATYALAGVVHAFIRFILNRACPHLRRTRTHMRRGARLLHLVAGTALLFWMMITCWNPVIIFVSGLVCFQALTGWSPIFALFTKQT